MGRWKRAFDLGQVPRQPGVYAFFAMGVLVYIGQSANLRRRVWEHGIVESGGQIFMVDARAVTHRIRLKFRKCTRYGEWLMVEHRLIQRLKPPWNRTHSDYIRPHKPPPPRKYIGAKEKRELGLDEKKAYLKARRPKVWRPFK